MMDSRCTAGGAYTTAIPNTATTSSALRPVGRSSSLSNAIAIHSKTQSHSTTNTCTLRSTAASCHATIANANNSVADGIKAHASAIANNIATRGRKCTCEYPCRCYASSLHRFVVVFNVVRSLHVGGAATSSTFTIRSCLSRSCTSGCTRRLLGRRWGT